MYISYSHNFGFFFRRASLQCRTRENRAQIVQFQWTELENQQTRRFHCRAQTVVEKSYLSFSRSSSSSRINFYSRPLFTRSLCVFPSLIVREGTFGIWGNCFQASETARGRTFCFDRVQSDKQSRALLITMSAATLSLSSSPATNPSRFWCLLKTKNRSDTIDKLFWRFCYFWLR